MRTTALALFALCVIACSSGPRSTPLSNRTPAPPAIAIEIDDALRRQAALGIPLNLELRVARAPVGTCHLAYDLWEETYRVSTGQTSQHHADLIAALRSCIAPGLVDGDATVVVHELAERPLHQPPSYPVF